MHELPRMIRTLAACVLVLPPFVVATGCGTDEPAGEPVDGRMAAQEVLVEALTAAITEDFVGVVEDVLEMAASKALGQLLDGGTDTPSLETEYLELSGRRRVYDQVRFLAESGVEVVRVNDNEGTPVVVAKEQLQDKGDRYYFEDTFSLDQGEVFVSPFDLNLERGQVEAPLKPMIRFAAPVFDSQWQKKGVVIVNYRGTNIHESMGRVSADFSGEVALLNAEGYWLYSEDEDDEFGFMFEDGTNRTFAQRYPVAWQEIRANRSGSVRNEDGLFTYDTVYPRALQSDSLDDFWKIVAYDPE